MAKFKVYAEVTTHFSTIVEADSKGEAMEKAANLPEDAFSEENILDYIPEMEITQAEEIIPQKVREEDISKMMEIFDNLTRNEAKELLQNTGDEPWEAVFDSVEDYAIAELDTEVPLYIMEYIDLKKFGNDIIGRDTRSFKLSSGKVAIR